MNQRARLLSNFLIIISINVLIVISFIFYNNRKDQINRLTDKIETAHIALLKDHQLMSDFIREEVTDESFFITGQSKYQNEHYLLTDSIYQMLEELKNDRFLVSNNTKTNIESLQMKINEYKALFDIFANMMLQRGFKDYGKEGEMRRYAHQLEKKNNFDKIALLMLRRHEKDYIIRHDTNYVKKFNDLANSLKENRFISNENLTLLTNYQLNFNDMVLLDKEIGINGKQGFKKFIASTQNEMHSLFHSTSEEIITELKQTETIYFYVYYSIILLIFILGIALSIIISDRITKPIIYLSEHINHFVRSKFKEDSEIKLKFHNDEVGRLFQDFNLLKMELFHFISDLNQKKEEAENAYKMKSIFIAKISHEIRTPMSGIISMAKFLEETPLNKDQQDYVETIQFSSNYLLSIINDILDYSKIEANAIEFEHINFDLYKELKKIIHFLEFKAKSKKINLVLEIDPSVPFYLLGDPLRLNQIITNLTVNAIKFTFTGYVQVKVNCIHEFENKVMLRFTISDTGIGMSPEVIERIFLPYHQADLTTTRNYGGTGLGLVISKELVNMMKGRIGVTSKEGDGSIFWFELEYEKSINDFHGSLSIEEKELFRNKKFLIVEEDPGYRKNMRYKLEKFETIVEEAVGLDDLIEKANNMTFDFLIIDTQSLRDYEPDLTDTFTKLVANKNHLIVATISDYNETEIEMFKNIGAHIVMVKPFKVKEMIRNIEKYNNSKE